MFLKTSLACSFCGKSASEVSKLVAGPKVYICDACVATASRIMSDSGGETSPQRSLLPTRRQRFVGRLSQLLRPFRSGASQPLSVAW
ncbi:MAG TPA: ClpX C4-type zinc finger protein [Nitrospira sp.]|nr:ClpX C4-type zinc finger protein [Nitrospira sp.]